MIASIRLGSLQRAGLECHAPQEDLDALEIIGDRLTFAPADAGRVAAIVNDASNSADDQHEREGEPADRRMAVALGNLAVRVGRAGRAV